VSANRRFLLMGSGEFEPWSTEAELAALEGRQGSVAILPTASAPESDAVFDRWGRMGLDHYASVGIDARVVPLKRREDAAADDVLDAIRDAGMVFFSGGNPRYLAETIGDTPFWELLTARMADGLVFAGCSAGAMIAGSRPGAIPRFGAMWAAGLGLVPGGSFGAHWDRMRFIPGMRGLVISRAGEGWFAGIDERTAILGDGERWRVFGLGTVTLRMDGRARRIRAGGDFETPG
jgi:cyanophycinase